MEKFLEILGGVTLFIMSCIFEGYVFITLWKWFIIPTFQAPVLSIPVGIGIILTISLLTSRKSQKENEKNVGEKMAEILLYVILVLIMGYIIQLFI